MARSNKGEYADLHVHTFFSDGMLSPGDVVKRAAETGLKALSITDHDCVDGISEGLEAADREGVELVPGIEVSSSCGDTEIHILGYFVDHANGELLSMLKEMQKNRLVRIKKMVNKLNDAGIDVDLEKVLAASEKETIGRPHLARILVQEKKARDIKEAFDRYIGDGKPFHVKHERMDFRKAIKMITLAGGVPVLAHPGTMGRDEFIPDYVEAGIKGIEAFHSNHSAAASARYIKLAEKYGLIVTGGSDCHATYGEATLVGTVKVGYSAVEQLRALSGKNGLRR